MHHKTTTLTFKMHHKTTTKQLPSPRHMHLGIKSRGKLKNTHAGYNSPKESSGQDKEYNCSCIMSQLFDDIEHKPHVYCMPVW